MLDSGDTHKEDWTGKILKTASPVATLMFFMLLSSLLFAEQRQSPTIAIIIDDMGHHYEHGVSLINLPYPLTLSFLPDRRFTKRLVDMANFHGKEIMLHAPMQNSLGIGLGYGGLKMNMSEAEIKSTLIHSFEKINHMVGLNNHMGSLLTTNPKTMQWVMETVSQYPFFFVDSRTSSLSVAARTAEKLNIPNLSRDIFLDHVQDREFIQRQFLKLLDIAQEKGTAIAIGHPHPETIEYLSLALPKLDEKGISIASVSNIWQIRHPNKDIHQELATRARQRAGQIQLADYTQKNGYETQKNGYENQRTREPSLRTARQGQNADNIN
jgi:polysaccharide deacetylase 2 family uncharacterized protein YibQ